MTVWIVAKGERGEGQTAQSIWTTRNLAEYAALRIETYGEPWKEYDRGPGGTRWESGCDVLTVLAYALDQVMTP